MRCDPSFMNPSGFPNLEIDSSENGLSPTFNAFASAKRSEIEKKFATVNSPGPTGTPCYRRELANSIYGSITSRRSLGKFLLWFKKADN